MSSSRLAAMAVFILASFLAVGVSADHISLKTNESFSSDISEKTGSQCDFPFQAVGNNCFFFSEEQKSFDEAELYCESLGHGHAYEVSLAMLDYEEAEDQALFDVVASKDNTFWVGGKSEDGINWKWLDNHNINLQATFWNCGEPAEEQNSCTALQPYAYSHGPKPYLYAHDCSESLNFICQTVSHVNFRRIGNYYYFISEEAGVPHASWQNARDYCQSLSVPVGYHADLAVLGLPDQDSYYLLENLVAGYDQSYTWMGAVAESDCKYHWVDGREVTTSSLYWRQDQPSCGSSKYAVLWKLKSSGCNRNYLADVSENYQYPFICQLTAAS